MATGRNNYQPRSKAAFVLKMRELGYLVEQQQETITSIMGALVAIAEEIDALKNRVKTLESAQPATVVR